MADLASNVVMPERKVVTATAQANNAPLTGVSEAQKQVPPPPPETPAPKEPDMTSQRMAMLTRKEAQALQRHKEAVAKEQVLAQREAQLQKQAQEWEQLKSDPLKALSALGLTYNQITEVLMNQGNVTPDIQIQRLREEFRQGQAQQQAQWDAQQKAQQDYLTQQQTQIIDDFKNEIKQEALKYKLISHFKREDLIYEVIEEQHNKTGKVMAITEAAGLVEKYLEAEARKAAELLQPVPEATEQVPQDKPPPFAPAVKQTLTNSASPTLSPKTSRNVFNQSMPLDEAIQRALAKRGIKK